MNDSVQYRHHHDGDSCHGHVDQISILDSGSDNMNDSVQYRHHHHGDSCHGHVDQVTSANSGGHVVVEQSVHPPSWVHVAKSNKPSSIRTQAAAIAYIGKKLHSKAKHRRNRRAKKKRHKQQIMLREVIVPPTIHQNMLSQFNVINETVVVDGGDTGNPPICPPDGVNWRCLSVIEGSYLHVQDETDPVYGLTSTRVDGTLPFIRLPRQQSLNIIGKFSMNEIVIALEQCEKLKKSSLQRSKKKCVFGDYGEPVMYTSAGVQVSRNSRGVLNHNAFMEKLHDSHWLILLKLMRHAETAFESLVDNEVISHLYHAKKVVNFKTMSMPPGIKEMSPLKYYGALAFGCNVFLPCHTDDDFTMSMIQIHLKGKDKYDVDDNVVVYFCFPTLGVAVPLRPGDFFIFNAIIPHCVSSRCRQEDCLMIISLYLKTSVVGMNNNLLPVNENQLSLSQQYCDSISK
jgi:hypothetical protein